MNSKLSDHKFKKGKFVTPMNDALSDIGKKNYWDKERLPEYLWIGLIIKYYGRKDGLIKCGYIIQKLIELFPDINLPKLSKILKLDNEEQAKFYDFVLEYVDKDVLAPLTLIVTYSKYKSFALKFNNDLSVKNRIDKINDTLEDANFHQSYLSTDIRFIILYCNLLAGKLNVPGEILEKLLSYPDLEHDNEKMREIRPSVRSMEQAMVSLEEHDLEYLKLFWDGVSKLNDCELMYIEYSEEELDTTKYIEKVKNILSYYTDLLTASNPLDNKMLVLLGIVTYSYKRLQELVNHKLYNTISGRSIVRVLVEDYIMMKYLLKNEAFHKDIWLEYQYYGIGQYKLIVERYLQSGEELKENHVQFKYMNLLIDEYTNREFIDMDTKYFNKEGVREKAISVDEKELFDYYYDYDSAFEHGLWGAIRESSLLKCSSPAHQYHCIPDVENLQKMTSVLSDCIKLMNKTINFLNGIYGIPAHLKLEEDIDGN